MSIDVFLHTAEELYNMPRDGYRYELVEGVLNKMSPAGGEHGAIASFLNGHLMFHVRRNRLGTTYAAETGFKIRTNPDTVLAPDVAFVAADRVRSISDRRKFVPLAPDLAVEVLSPGDTERESLQKVAQWLLAGTQAVIVVDPYSKTVRVFRTPDEPTLLTERDTLDVPDIVPGWAVPVSEIFASE
ncbi:MAG: Uma2 family endonuclease [Planctomycetota bacterium]